MWGYIADMEARRGLGNKSLAGERCATYAAEVLVSLSGACSSCTQHSAGGGGSHVVSAALHSLQGQLQYLCWGLVAGRAAVATAVCMRRWLSLRTQNIVVPERLLQSLLLIHFQGSKVRRQSAEVISAMASPPRKRARV